MTRARPSPYLSRDDRLADVIAAIQAAGTYKYYKLDFTGWADRISGDESKAFHWRKVPGEGISYSSPAKAEALQRRRRLGLVERALRSADTGSQDPLFSLAPNGWGDRSPDRRGDQSSHPSRRTSARPALVGSAHPGVRRGAVGRGYHQTNLA